MLFISILYWCLAVTTKLAIILLLVVQVNEKVRHIIIHQTQYEKSDWSRAFNQFTIACELNMINVTSAVDITFIMSSSTSAWLLSPLVCSPQNQKLMAERFASVSEDELCEKCMIKQLLNSVFA